LNYAVTSAECHQDSEKSEYLPPPCAVTGAAVEERGKHGMLLQAAFIPTFFQLPRVPEQIKISI
jgi:hypothetical protein